MTRRCTGKLPETILSSIPHGVVLYLGVKMIFNRPKSKKPERRQIFKTREKELAKKLIREKGFEQTSITGDNWRGPKIWWLIGYESRLINREMPYVTKAAFTQRPKLKEELGYAERT